MVQFWGVGHDFLTPQLLIPFIFMAAIKKYPVSFVVRIWEVLRGIPSCDHAVFVRGSNLIMGLLYKAVGITG